MIREHTYPHPGAAAEALTESVAASLESALARRPEATLVVSGGSTPYPFFERLRRVPLPWERIRITLADERWVPGDHPESNERMVRETLLRDAAATAQWVGLKTPEEDPASAVAACEARIAALRPFDVVVLGMGGDGHTASLFPHAPGLAAALDPEGVASCAAVAAAEGRRPRMSLTLAALLDSERIVLHCTGEEKRRVLRQAREEGPAADLPIRAVLRETSRGIDIYWAP
jgi:6-phosphogluconolactonase